LVRNSPPLRPRQPRFSGPRVLRAEGCKMNSRVHPKYKTRYRVTNWAGYDQALVQRGDITLWITPAAIRVWKPRASRRRGAARMYSDLAIESALTLRLLFRLPLRQAEGFLRSLG